MAKKTNRVPKSCFILRGLFFEFKNNLSTNTSKKHRKYLVETCFSGFFAHAQRVMALKALIASLAKREEVVHFSGRARKMNHIPFFCERSEL
jgi:hypothetical protein